MSKEGTVLQIQAQWIPTRMKPKDPTETHKLSKAKDEKKILKRARKVTHRVLESSHVISRFPRINRITCLEGAG